MRDTPPPHTLEAFLERSALISDMDTADEDEGKIALMTLHNAKGLEFPIVFIAGLEEGLLPHQFSLAEGNVEEERRLCYVGMTRAKKRLYLTWSRARFIHTAGGFQRVAGKRSRFLDEIPPGCIEPAAVKRNTAFSSQEPASQSPHTFAVGKVTMAATAPVAKKAQHTPEAFIKGVTVAHPKFGNGTVISTNGEGEEKIAVVRFDTAGEKKMFVAFAPLKIV